MVSLAVAMQAMAYNSGLADCEKFAALWSGSCGGTNDDAEYVSADWETTGAGVTRSSCVSANDDDGNAVNVFAPDSGASVETFTVNARNCITCREDKDIKDKIWIRYQTNNMPKHCYGTDVDASYETDSQKYPKTQRWDFEVAWNNDVLHKKNTADSLATDAATTTSLLCDNTKFASSTLPKTTGYNEYAAFADTSIVGFAMDNVAIFNALSDSNKDIIQEKELDRFDDCMLSMSTTGNAIKYHTMSGCLGAKASKTVVPGMCKDADQDTCRRDPLNYTMKKTNLTESPYEKAMGLAKDGHIIVGPYNSDGELWSCDDHDICNGAFLSDNSYAYVMTTTFPYVVGCWGPGPTQSFIASCSPRSCGSGAIDDFALAFVAITGALIALTQ